MSSKSCNRVLCGGCMAMEMLTHAPIYNACHPHQSSFPMPLKSGCSHQYTVESDASLPPSCSFLLSLNWRATPAPYCVFKSLNMTMRYFPFLLVLILRDALATKLEAIQFSPLDKYSSYSCPSTARSQNVSMDPAYMTR